MYKPMLFLHWKQVRLALVPFIIAAFGLPLMLIDGFGTPAGMTATTMEAYRFVNGYQEWLALFPALAVGIGVTMALSAWNWDHQYKHVYALSLPLTRWEYTISKMVAGAQLALIPAVALWLGAHVAAASITLPAGLNAYPNQLAIRFGLAVLLSYAGFFALASGTVKTTIWLVTAVVSFVVIGNMANGFLGTYYPWFAQTNLVEQTMLWMLEAPGPFEVFSGSWSLIDV